MREARRHARVQVMIPCGIRIARQDPPDAWGHIHDISLGGVELFTYFPIAKGQTVFLTFSVSRAFNFSNARGTVMRVREEDGYLFAGISFDEAVDKNHLKNAVQSLLE